MAGKVTADLDNHGGMTVAQQAAVVVADSAARPDNYRWVLISIGSNDLGTVGDAGKQAQFETDLAFVLDTVHARWPAAKVYASYCWRRGYMAESNTLAGWIDNVIAAGRTGWAFPGTDARVWMEGGDNGATYSVDGVHANAAGYTLQAGLWQTLMGY